MLKKYFSILMMSIALAIMLGHNIIGHHHDIEHSKISHHSHSDHDHHQHDNDTDDECEDWKHIFSGLHHGADGIVCLISKTASYNNVKLIPKFNASNVTNFTFKHVINDIRPNAPPFVSEYYNSHNNLPSGLRAPPTLLV